MNDSGAVIALGKAIDEQKGFDPLALVTVVVPSHISGVLLQRELARQNERIANVYFKTPLQIARDLLEGRVDTALKRVSNMIFNSVIRQAVAAKGDEHVSSLSTEEMLRIYDERGIDQQTLVQLGRLISEMAVANRTALEGVVPLDASSLFVVEVYRRTRKMLDDMRFSMESDAFEAAVALISGVDFDATWVSTNFGRVIVYAPHALVNPASRLFEVLVKLVPVLVLNLTCGIETVDSDFRSRLRLLNPEYFSSTQIRNLQVSKMLPPAVIVEVPDRASEVDVVISLVISALKEGISPDQICIYYTSEKIYLPSLLEAASRAFVPISQLTERNVRVNRALELLKTMNALFHSGARADLVDLIAKGLFVWGRVELESVDVERYTIEQELTGNLFQFASDMLANDPSEPPFNAHDKSIAIGRKLALFLDSLKATNEKLETALRVGTWRDVAHACWSCLAVVFSPIPRLYPSPDELPVNDIAESGINELVETLRHMILLDDAGEQPSQLGFWSVLNLEVEGPVAAEERTVNGIRLSSAFTFNPVATKRAFFIGLSDDAFPHSGPSRLLSEQTRRNLGLLTNHDRAVLDLRAIWIQLRIAESVVLTIPRVDITKSGALFPAPIIGDIEDVYRDNLSTIQRKQVRSRTQYLAEIEEPNDLRMLNIANIAFAGAGFISSVSEDEEGGVREDVVSLPLPRTRIDGVIDVSSGAARALETISPTGIEKWLDCPYEFFIRNVLFIEEVVAPEDKVRLDALSRGTLLHTIFERIVTQREVLLRGGAGVPIESPKEIIEKTWDEMFVGFISRSRARQFWLEADRRRIIREVEKFVEMDIGFSKNVQEEQLEIAVSGSIELLDVSGEKMTVSLRAKIDRISSDANGAVTIVDYKTGKRDAYITNKGLDPRKVQVSLYKELLRSIGLNYGDLGDSVVGKYWFVSEVGGYDIYQVTEDEYKKALEVVGIAVGAMRKGIFSPGMHLIKAFRPCPYCEPDHSGQNVARHRFLDTLGSGAGRFDLAEGQVDRGAWADLISRIDVDRILSGD